MQDGTDNDVNVDCKLRTYQKTLVRLRIEQLKDHRGNHSSYCFDMSVQFGLREIEPY